MKSYLILLAIIIFPMVGMAQENASTKQSEVENSDSLRTADLDKFWNKLSRTVEEGDLEGYAGAYHEDAVVVFGSNESVPIQKALDSWAQGFIDTKAGKASSNVEFRFSERIGDETTAYETGIFYFTLKDETGKFVESYYNMEALLVKKDESWMLVMENQIAPATKEDWEALK